MARDTINKNTGEELQYMRYVRGFTFLIGGRECLQPITAEQMLGSLAEMKRQLHTDTVILAFQALMENAHSEEIDWKSPDTPPDSLLEQIILGAERMGLRVFLKPMVNCRNGVWRGYISFLEPDVICEPKWGGWFQNYESFMVHYADLAERTHCELLLVGCEMVMAQHREQDWRKLIATVRDHFHGLLSLNVDKYQEDRISYWDALDVISSSGYYPTGSWSAELARIQKVVGKYRKPFFFAECGCPCRRGSEKRPNDWTTKEPFDQDTQTRYYEEMFEAGREKSWIGGYAGWAWRCDTGEKIADETDDYGVAGRDAAAVIRSFYDEM